MARFREARAAGRSQKEVLLHINSALQHYQRALELLPADAVRDLALTHNALGAIFANAGDLDSALTHYRDAIRLHETQGNPFQAAQTRFNVANGLARAGRFADAREYALAALRNFETFGDRAADEIQKTQTLIAQIEKDLAKGGTS